MIVEAIGDGLLQQPYAVEMAATNTALGALSEEALHQVEPAGTSGGEMDEVARPDEPTSA